MPPRAAKRSADHLRLVAPPAALAPPAAASPVVAPARAASRLADAGAAAAHRSGDWLWSGLGVGAATASAGFCIYALVFSTGQVVPSGDFNLFARYDRLYQAQAARHGAPGTAVAAMPAAAQAPAASGAPAGVAAADAVDFTPTGTVPPASDRSQGDAGAGRSGRYSAENRPLPDFTLRDVFDGKALVESRASLSVIKPGSVLDGAGEVLSIERRGENWVVLTANGVIAGQRH